MTHPAPDILDLDFGNSRLKYRCGVHRGALGYEDPLPAVLADVSVRRIRVASVLDDQPSTKLAQRLQATYGPECEFAQSEKECGGVRNGYVDPSMLGVDRWLAVIAGYKQFGAALVVDLGTAGTFDYVTNKGKHLGGYIVPGLRSMQQSLLENTAFVRPEIAARLTDLGLGTDTQGAVARGAFVTIVRLIEAELVRARQLCHHSARLVLCGGDAVSIAKHLRCDYQLVPDLVLDGLEYSLP